MFYFRGRLVHYSLSDSPAGLLVSASPHTDSAPECPTRYTCTDVATAATTLFVFTASPIRTDTNCYSAIIVVAIIRYQQSQPQDKSSLAVHI